MACGLDYSVERMNGIEFFVVQCVEKKVNFINIQRDSFKKKDNKAYSYTIYIVI